MARRRERGVTLIELMLTVAIGSIVGATFFAAMLAQQGAYIRRLDNLEAQQNARAVLSLLKSHVRMAAFGYNPNKEMRGAIPIGACYSDGNPVVHSLVCDNVDENRAVAGVQGSGELEQTLATRAGSDRMRVSYALADGLVEAPTNTHPLPLNVALDGVPPGHPIAGLALMSGACNAAPPDFAADLITVRGVPSNYSFVRLDSFVSSGCSSYADGFVFAPAEVVDFYIDRSVPRNPRLMMKRDPSADMDDTSAVHVAAYDIDDLQIQYGVDANADGAFDPVGTVDPDGWCNDPRIPADGGDCATDLSSAENYFMITSVRLAVVPRTRNYSPDREYGEGGDRTMQVFNHTLVGQGDGFTRWVFRATVALRNRDLR